MNVNEIISKINDMNLQSEEDLQEVESVLTEMDNALIEPLFRLLERHPHFNFGNPGRIVHYLEKFDNNTYAPFLYASIRRVPTEYNIWMLNRKQTNIPLCCIVVPTGGCLAEQLPYNL